MAVRIEWMCELEESDFSEQWIGKLEQLLQHVATREHITSGIVSLTFVDDATIQKLNKQYRGIDHPTDVLSFPMEDHRDDDGNVVLVLGDLEVSVDSAEPPERLLGDIVISVPTAKEQSETYGHSLEREIGFLFVHGLLHLIGYDHQDEAAEEEMFDLQEQILQQAGLAR